MTKLANILWLQHPNFAKLDKLEQQDIMRTPAKFSEFSLLGGAINEHSPDTFLIHVIFWHLLFHLYFPVKYFQWHCFGNPFLELQCNCDQMSFWWKKANWWFCNSCCSCPEEMRGNGNRKYWFMKPSPALPSHYVESLCLGGFCNPLSFHVPPPLLSFPTLSF